MPTKQTALKYLRKDEWTMGNGQCHDCCGSAPRRGWWTKTVGHKKYCRLAKAIESLGGKVVWEKENKSKRRFQIERFFKSVSEKTK